MAGFGVFKASDVDMEAVRDLPTGTDDEGILAFIGPDGVRVAGV